MSEPPEPSRARGASPAAREVRAWLEAHGVRPTKTRGQNFLTDPNLARAIVQDAGVRPGDRVLEVGVGCGFLTEPLVRRGVELLAVEIDERLLAIARERLGPGAPVRWLHADVLAGKRRLAPEVEEALWPGGDWHLVANLPYGVAGPLAATLAAHTSAPRSMTILVQLEVAERLAARVGTPAWGALSARVQLDYRGRLGREVGAHLFWPRPRVRSRIVRLERRTEAVAGRPPGERDAYGKLVEGLFQRRRKTVRKGLEALLGDRPTALEALERAGIDPGERPEGLAPEALLALVRVLPGPLG